MSPRATSVFEGVTSVEMGPVSVGLHPSPHPQSLSPCSVQKLLCPQVLALLGAFVQGGALGGGMSLLLPL